MRDYSSPADLAPANATATSMAVDALSAIGNGAVRMIVGHTPQR